MKGRSQACLVVMSPMLRYAALAAALAFSAGTTAVALAGLSSAAHAAAEAPLRGAQGSEPLTASLSKSPDGHFWANALVEGEPVRFLVDTGASNVSLTPDDARRLGLDPSTMVYDEPVRTAGGDSLAAHVQLANVSVNGARVTKVEALVIGRGLPASLLGMSYLGRLSRFEATPEALILQP